MPKLNEHYQDLKESYLFAEIAHRVAAYEAEHPDAKIIRLGIGDVTAKAWGCDLTYDYVKINGDYRS